MLNYRLQNIYNVATSSRQYLLKFSIPDSKKVVVLEYGNRIHLTDFERPTAQQPSNFVTKLRRHLKTRRLSGIKQIPNDRVLVLEFSDGLFYLVFEFFSAGNILLLDEHQKILSLQRLVTAKEDVDRYAVNEEYKMFDKSLFTDDYEYNKTTFSSEDIKNWIQTHKQFLAEHSNTKKMKVFSIHKLAFVNSKHLPSELIQRCFHDCGINPSQSCLNFEENDEGMSSIVKALEACEDMYLSLLSSDSETTGYIIGKKIETDNSDLSVVYDEFHPFKPYKENSEKFEFIEVAGYNKTLDKFFSTIESSKLSLKIEQQKQHANKRLEKAKTERDRQIQTLLEQQELNAKKGELIQYHAGLVDECRAYIQQFLDQQMDWQNIQSVIDLEKRKKNRLANLIGLPLNLKENKFKILLPDIDNIDNSSESEADSETESESESDSESDSDDDDFPKKRNVVTKKTKQKAQRKSNVIPIWIDIALTSFANARLYFDTKKSAETKQAKVEQSTTMALKNAERKITHDLAKSLKQESEVLKQMRPKYWFEKFFWFVSNEGYLCLAGRDNSQIDMIYYRHFSDNDFFVSSDLEGSLKVFIKNPFKGEAVPPSTIMQAGVFAMSASSGWNGKVTTSAWVLHGTEISKRDFDGSLVPSGEFNYKGKKEYLPPAQLVMGFGFYSLVDEETTKRYAENRVKREQEHGLTITLDNKKSELEKIKEKQKVGDSREERPQPSTNEEGIPEDNTPESDSESVSETASVSNESKVNKAVPIPRGKKAKLKKIAKKYADQDEEERRLRMDALGVLKQVEQREEQKLKEVLEKLEATKRFEEREAAKERRRKQEEKEYQKYILQEAESDESSITNYLEILDSFVPKPSSQDHIINMVPVFAPWQSLQKFKYKVKIQPGSGKKTKSITDSLNYFTNRKMDNSASDVDLDWPAEREIIKTMKPNDMVGVFTVSKVKLVLPSTGDSKSNKKQAPKKGKKK